MPRPPDAGLKVVLDQRRRQLQEAQLALAEQERALQQEAQRLRIAETTVASVRNEMYQSQSPREGHRVNVSRLAELEQIADRCDSARAAQCTRVETAQREMEGRRLAVAEAHRGVRALDLILEARAKARAERHRRAELHDADELAARAFAASHGHGVRAS